MNTALENAVRHIELSADSEEDRKWAKDAREELEDMRLQLAHYENGADETIEAEKREAEKREAASALDEFLNTDEAWLEETSLHELGEKYYYGVKEAAADLAQLRATIAANADLVETMRGAREVIAKRDAAIEKAKEALKDARPFVQDMVGIASVARRVLPEIDEAISALESLP